MLLKFQLTYKNAEDQFTPSAFNLNTDGIYLCGSSKYLGEWSLTDSIEMRLKTNRSISNGHNPGSISSNTSQSSAYSDLNADEW